jgi:hypothetical protein
MDRAKVFQVEVAGRRVGELFAAQPGDGGDHPIEHGHAADAEKVDQDRRARIDVGLGRVGSRIVDDGLSASPSAR